MGRRPVRRSLVLLALLAGCQARPSGPAGQFFTTSDGVKLHYVDWGGSGDPLIFLPGNGNTAHVFDTFAPRFTGGHRVVALTHRGFGDSDKPAWGYDRARLATDIRDLLDYLKLTRATLIGHSLAGEEMGRFAVLFPDRVDRLVYLDAAYDRIAMRDAMHALKRHPPMEPTPDPTSADSASAAALAAYFTRVLGAPYPASEVAASSTVDSTGRIIGDRTPDSVAKAIQAALESPPYPEIRVPALAIYAVVDSLSTKARRSLGADTAEVSAALAAFVAHEGVMQRQREEFRALVAKGRVVELHGADHYLFLSNPHQVEHEIRDFLKS